MARVVPTQARREPEFDSGGFPEPGFRVRGEEGAEKKKRKPLSQQNTTLPKAAGETESRAPGAERPLQFWEDI